MEGSAGDVGGPPALSPFTGQVKLRAQGLAEVNHYSHGPSASLGLSHPWGGREGAVSQVGTSAWPKPASSVLPETSAFSGPAAPFASLSFPPLSPLPQLPLVRPLPAVSSALWLWQVDCRSWEDQLSLFGTELDGISFPKSPPAGQLLPTVLAYWPKGDCA